MCRLLGVIANQPVDLEFSLERFKKYGNCNPDGNNLYAFRYSNNSRDYYSLYNLKRDPSEHGSIELFSKETKAIIHSKSLKGEDAILVCSEKPTDEKWEEIRFGNLLIIESKLKMNVVEIR